MLARNTLFTILVLICLGSCSSDSEFILGGIHVDEPDYRSYVKQLKNQGFNTVEITVYAKQGDWDSDNFWHDGIDSAIINQLRIAQEEGVHSCLILRVALDHAFKRNKFLWHGMILPKDSLMDSWFHKYEEFVSLWAKEAERYDVELFVIGSEMKELVATQQFDSDSLLMDEYRQFYDWEDKSTGLIMKHESELKKHHLWVRGYNDFTDLESFLKEKNRANQVWADRVYCVSDSINRLQKLNARRAELRNSWEVLIKSVRQDYSGALSYAANFDNYNRIGFWDHLDQQGINAYFRLRKPGGFDTITVKQEMENSWRKVLSDLDTFQLEHGLDMPILFTELGYTFREKSTMAPWAHDEFSVIEYKDTSELIVWYEEEENLGERLTAIRSLRNVISERPNGSVELKGILYWKLSTFAEHKQYEDFLLHIGENSTDTLVQELVGIKEDYYERRN